ncbi:MAG: universal stress protein [Rhodanobacter sp.]|nr:MAG: universal stress protein [Rhodanobacter sp.]TAL99326.1 MAG: universal stress protein [Rhodanobacter sp.]TAM38572.1 MAG: universal stress protein [Rhodanobacter sp.]TAN23719.1 MAG: universal stress protein [Rhodanobacter sp.]
MFKHILLPTDGSDLALRAVDTGIALAASLGADVYALHVVAPFPAFSYMVDIVQANETFYLQEAIKQADACLQEVHKRADIAGVSCKSEYVTDSRPYTAIVAAAARQGCDLIVMASHGLQGIDRLLLGSVTQKVLVGGEVPVLVCH